MEVKKIGRILDTRWVASSFRTVSAVWNNFHPLCAHFEKASNDPERNSKDRASFTGLLRRMRSPEFLTDLALMFDTLYELSNLSQKLQNREMTIISADKLIRRTIRRLEALQFTLGSKSLEVQTAVHSLSFHSITLHNQNIVTINKQRFLECLVNRMKDRLFVTTFSRSPTDQNNYNTLMSEFNILNKDSWPIEHQPGYGESEIKSICQRFGLNEALYVNAFCDYYENSGTFLPPTIKPLFNCIQLVPCSTAECERGFSHMNIILEDRRSRLLVSHISALLFIKLNGPPLFIWDPSDYARCWLRNHRSASDTQIRGRNSQIVEENPVWKYI